MKRFLHRNGLSLALLGMFLLAFGAGQLLCGWHAHNDDRAEHGEAPLSLGAYLRAPHFLEATMENWESEFLEMFVYVGITAFLFQQGSAESRDPDHPAAARAVTARSPWPVRRGGWWRAVYSHSLSLAFALLFLAAFSLHARSSTALENEERTREQLPPLTVGAHLQGAKFWFQSFQNWQSEFLALTSMVLLTIFLREKDSPESKPVAAPHAETGA